MRIVSSGFTTGAMQPIDDAVVVVDEYHRARLGLGMLGTGCELVADLNQILDSLEDDGVQRIAIISGRPEEIVFSVEAFAQRAAARGATLSCIMPKYELFGAYDAIASSKVARSVAVAAVHLEGSLACLVVRSATPDDHPATPFFAGLMLGIQTSGSVSWHDPHDSPRVSELEEKLLSVLESQELVHASPPPIIGTEVTGAVESPASEVASERIADLENQLVGSTAKLDALQRKYDALARSRLGRLTLDHWERNRRRGK